MQAISAFRASRLIITSEALSAGLQSCPVERSFAGDLPLRKTGAGRTMPKPWAKSTSMAAQPLQALLILYHLGDGANADRSCSTPGRLPPNLSECVRHAQDLQNDSAIDLEEIQRQRLDMVKADAHSTKTIEREATPRGFDVPG